MDVVSEPGKGTTFFICLPAVESEERVEAPTVAPLHARKGKILVMDDEDMILNVAGEMIKALGHEVEFARHGEAAIEMYQSALESGKPFDIVILDLTIKGGMGGAETIERLRALNSEVIAILSSGYSDYAISDLEKSGFRARLAKPYKFETLRDKLDELLNES